MSGKAPLVSYVAVFGHSTLQTAAKTDKTTENTVLIRLHLYFLFRSFFAQVS